MRARRGRGAAGRGLLADRLGNRGRRPPGASSCCVSSRPHRASHPSLVGARTDAAPRGWMLAAPSVAAGGCARGCDQSPAPVTADQPGARSASSRPPPQADHSASPAGPVRTACATLSARSMRARPRAPRRGAPRRDPRSGATVSAAPIPRRVAARFAPVAPRLVGAHPGSPSTGKWWILRAPRSARRPLGAAGAPSAGDDRLGRRAFKRRPRARTPAA